jgi:hypothetical protein
VDEACFVEDAVFAESAVNSAAKTCAEGLEVKGASEMALVEEGYYLVCEVLAIRPVRC